MNRLQTNAWANVITALVGLILAAIAFPILYPLLGIRAAIISFGLFAMPVFFRGLVKRFFKREQQKVKMDERDLEICSAATGIGQSAHMVFGGVACVTLYMVYVDEGYVPVDALLYVFFGGGFLGTLVADIATLILYGREDGDGQ